MKLKWRKMSRNGLLTKNRRPCASIRDFCNPPMCNDKYIEVSARTRWSIYSHSLAEIESAILYTGPVPKSTQSKYWNWFNRSTIHITAQQLAKRAKELKRTTCHSSHSKDTYTLYVYRTEISPVDRNSIPRGV